MSTSMNELTQQRALCFCLKSLKVTVDTETFVRSLIIYDIMKMFYGRAHGPVFLAFGVYKV